jgi:hypothetical protein
MYKKDQIYPRYVDHRLEDMIHLDLAALVFNRDAQQGNSLRHSVIESFYHSTQSTNH